MPTRLHSLRFLALIGRWVLACFVLSLGVAIASPIVKPQATELVCSAAGAVKVIVQTDDGPQELAAGASASHLDCPLCLLTGAPPPLPQALSFATPLPLGRAVQSIPAARLAAVTAAPLPARGPPFFS